MHPRPVPPARRGQRWFADFEALQAIPGWDVRCLQTTPGRLEGESRDLYLDDLQLLCEDFRNVTTNYFGSAPADSMTFGVARFMKGEGRLNGVVWGEGVCVFDTRSELNSIVPPVQLLSVVVGRKLLCDYLQLTESIDLDHWLARRAIVVNDPSLADRVAEPLLDLLDATFDPVLDLDAPAQQRAIRHSVLELISPIIVDRLGVNQKPRRELGYLEVVRRAREYAHERIADPLQVIDVCGAVGVSRRTLQTSFQEVLGISPLTYLRAVRLNGARRMLLRGEPEMKVKDAVEAWGFWHLSRFSEEYRRLFGELPSQTLRRQQRLP